MQRTYTAIGTYLIAGILGGAISRMLPTAVPVALAQSPKKEDAKVIRAERIELINNRGTPLAVLEVTYSPNIPGGSPKLTMTDRDILQDQPRKVVISPFPYPMDRNSESSVLSSGILRVSDPWGGVVLGRIQERGTSGAGENGLMIVSAKHARATYLDGRQVNVVNELGFPIATLP